MKRTRIALAAVGLTAAVCGACVDDNEVVAARVAPNLDPVAGRTLLEPVHVTATQKPDPSAQPPDPYVDPPAISPVPGLKADGSIALVRRLP